MNPGRVLKPRVCEIIWNVKQLYDANKTVFDERNQLTDRNLHTRTRYIRDVLIHEVLTGFGIPNPIEAANARERMHLLRQRTNIFWDFKVCHNRRNHFKGNSNGNGAGTF